MKSRGVLSASTAVLVAAAGSLVALAAGPAAAAAAPVLGGCSTAVADAATKVISLSGDCVSTSTVQVPNGWTLEGNGHAITASSAFAVPPATPPFNIANGVVVVAYEPDSSDPVPPTAPTMAVRDLRIDRQLSAEGSDFVSVTGVAVGSSTATLTRVDIENMATTSFRGGDGVGISNAAYEGLGELGTGGDVRLSDVQIRHHGTYGVFMNGGALTADHVTIGAATQPGSDALPENDFVAPASVFLLGTDSASITDSALAGNPYQAPELLFLRQDGQARQQAAEAPLGPDFADTGSAVHASQAGPVTMTRDTVYGTDSDVGVLVEESESSEVPPGAINRAAAPAATAPGTQVRVSCSVIGRTTTSAADPTLGFGVLNAAGPGTTVALGSGTTFSGWRLNTQGSTSTFPENCRAAVTPPSATLYPSKTDVCPGRRFGLFGTATPAAPGTRVLLQRKVGRKWRTVARTTEDRSGSYAFHRRAPRRGSQTYRVVIGGVVTNVVTIRARCGGTGSITSG